jgi:hypothetical protein
MIGWQKSTFSTGEIDQECVEISASGGTIHLRESDTPDAIITTTPARLAALLRRIKQTEG